MNDRSYTKLFSKIVTSSMWSLSAETRVVWVTMLAIMDQYSEVHASIPGLARTANVSVEACQAALEIFLNPDPFSRTKTNEGRRIRTIEGGWLLLNGDLYKAMMSLEERREYKRVKEAERRARKRGQNVDKRGHGVDTNGQNQAEADTEADTEAILTRDHSEIQDGGRASAVREESGSCELEEPKKQANPEVAKQIFAGIRAAIGKPESARPVQSSAKSLTLLEFREALCGLYGREPDDPLDYAEESMMVSIHKRKALADELRAILNFKSCLPSKEKRFFPHTMTSLLEKWSPTLDRARNYHPAEGESIQAQIIREA